MTTNDYRQDSASERIATAKAIAEAIVGVPIVLAQQVIQNVGDIKLDGDVTLQQRISQLRSLGEMTVRFGSRGLRSRFGGSDR
ncbi:MAG: hypothetical protein ACO3FT_06305 [Ilumatobacteraceae bacterium]|jgi:hypothetical protein